MKRVIAGAAAAVMAVGMLSACGNKSGSSEATGGSGSGGQIMLVAKANASDYWSKVKEGAMDAGKDLGVEVTFNGPDTESEGDKQLNQLQSAINASPIGIGFAPQDGAQDGAPDLLAQAKDAKIPVVIFDTPLKNESDAPIALIASDNKGMGAQAAEKLADMVGKKGKVAVIAHGEVGTAASRRDGFKEWMQTNAPDIKIVDIQNGESDPAKSRDKAQGILQAHPDLVGFFGTDDDSAIAIGDEVKAKGMDVKVIGIDATPDVLSMLSTGEISGLITQNPAGIGYKTVETLLNASKGKMPSEKNIVSESVWVTKDNMKDADIQKVIG